MGQCFILYVGFSAHLKGMLFLIGWCFVFVYCQASIIDGTVIGGFGSHSCPGAARTAKMKPLQTRKAVPQPARTVSMLHCSVNRQSCNLNQFEYLSTFFLAIELASTLSEQCSTPTQGVQRSVNAAKRRDNLVSMCVKYHETLHFHCDVVCTKMLATKTSCDMQWLEESALTETDVQSRQKEGLQGSSITWTLSGHSEQGL